MATTFLPRRCGLGRHAVGVAGLLLSAGCPLQVPTGNGAGTGNDGIPVVRLTVSNPSPQVSEEVVLTCEIVSGGSTGVTFAFQPDDGRLLGDRPGGIASFIVEGSDIGVAFSFTCSATNNTGTSEPSSEQVIIPT